MQMSSLRRAFKRTVHRNFLFWYLTTQDGQFFRLAVAARELHRLGQCGGSTGFDRLSRMVLHSDQTLLVDGRRQR